MLEFDEGNDVPRPHLDGLNDDVFKAFAKLLAAEGKVDCQPELGWISDSSDLFFSEETTDGRLTYHLYLYPQPYANEDNSRHLATLVRVPKSSVGTYLRYDLHASEHGGYIIKNGPGVVMPDIDDSEKAELTTKLKGFKDGLANEDPLLTKQSGW